MIIDFSGRNTARRLTNSSVKISENQLDIYLPCSIFMPHQRKGGIHESTEYS
jgi:hypothetical protein